MFLEASCFFQPPSHRTSSFQNSRRDELFAREKKRVEGIFGSVFANRADILRGCFSALLFWFFYFSVCFFVSRHDDIDLVRPMISLWVK